MPYKDIEQRRQRCRLYYQNNIETIQQHHDQYRIDNREAIRQYDVQRRLDNHEAIIQRAAELRADLKMKVFTYYGLKCKLCDEARLGALNIDHINGGGRKHKAQLGDSGDVIYKWLCRQYIETGQWPLGYRTLCANHNWREYLNNRSSLSMTDDAKGERDRREQTKLGVMMILGGAICTECGCDDLNVLDIHHPDNDGVRHRMEISNGLAGYHFYRALMKLNDFTSKLLTVSCKSCNSVAAFGNSYIGQT